MASKQFQFSSLITDSVVNPGWICLATQSASGALDSWQEYLMAKPAGDRLLLNVFADTVIGEIPAHWYNEDGELLPPYRTGDGVLRLPEVFNGQKVTGHDGDYLMGERVLAKEGSHVVLPMRSRDDLYDALEAIGWDVDDLEDVADQIEDLFQPADVIVGDHGSLMLLCPNTPAVRDWLTAHIDGEATWVGLALVVERRFASPLFERLQAEGFVLSH